MKISIITVCFNAKDTIEKTFLSVFNQTYKDVELIVIDAASEDGTLEVINKYKSKISHFVSEPDNGIYDAMNKGLSFANGDFILFLNANDVFYDERVLEKVVRALAQNPTAKLLFGDSEYVSEDKDSSKFIKFDIIKTDFSLLFNNICHQSIFYRKSLFESFGGYSSEYKFFADWAFNIKCLVKNKVEAVYLPVVLSKFQLGGACSSKDLSGQAKEEKFKLVKEFYPIFLPFFLADDLLEDVFKALYRFFRNRLQILKLANMLCIRKKCRLNIEVFKGSS